MSKKLAKGKNASKLQSTPKENKALKARKSRSPWSFGYHPYGHWVIDAHI